MSVFGIGTDLVALSRIEQAVERHGLTRFAQKILSETELTAMSQCKRPIAFLAKRFTAKEAAAKAFRTGFRGGLSLKHISVVNADNGAPSLVFTGYANTLIEQHHIIDTHISISDTDEYAVAYVVFCC